MAACRSGVNCLRWLGIESASRGTGSSCLFSLFCSSRTGEAGACSLSDWLLSTPSRPVGAPFPDAANPGAGERFGL